MAILYDNEGNQITMSEVNANASDIADLKSRMTTAEGDITSLDGRLDTSEPKISTLETTSSGLVANKEILGAKNLLPLTLAKLKTNNTDGTWSDNAYTLNGITFTINTDNIGNVTSIGVDGTATANAHLFICVSSYTPLVDLKFVKTNVEYIFSQETDTNDIRFRFDSGGDWPYPYVNGNDETTWTFNDSTLTYLPMITVNNGITITDKYTKLMIRLSSDNNPTFEPYAMSNQELTAKVLDLVTRVTALET